MRSPFLPICPFPLNPFAALSNQICKTLRGTTIKKTPPQKPVASTHNPTMLDHQPSHQPRGAHHEGSILTQSLVLHSPAKHIKQPKTTPYLSVMLTRAGAVVCYTRHGTRRVGRQPAPWAGFEPAAYYFWHSSSHLLNKMTKPLAKVLKLGQIPSHLISSSPVLSSSSPVLPSLISSPRSLVSYTRREKAWYPLLCRDTTSLCT